MLEGVSFYEYVTTPYQYNGKVYPLTDIGEYIRDFPGFPKKSIDRQEIYDLLKNIGAYKYVLKEFERSWEAYVSSSKAPREVKKQRWEEERAQYQKEETYLIKRYVSQIRNKVDYRDQSYEELERHREAETDTKAYDERMARVDRIIKEDGFLAEKPRSMSEQEWVKRKREIRARRIHESSEYNADMAIITHTPWWIFHDKVNAIWCDCEPEQLRRGIYCKTCKLVLKADKYMMELFKDAAEGRSPSHSLV
jgi:uncharacterized protein YozE (UPF0346 family)